MTATPYFRIDTAQTTFAGDVLRVALTLVLVSILGVLLIIGSASGF